jgi:hypothetical protein
MKKQYMFQDRNCEMGYKIHSGGLMDRFSRESIYSNLYTYI